ncbi:hypothetical protein K3495_g3279 [Podosphaera aphanis]|nr:hypothetical protein K3495_g3279 [Podosphaera aphanis]
MEIAKFIISGREKGRLHDDWESYRKQLTNRIHNLRKKLGITTKPGTKYISRPPVTAEDIRCSHEFVYLLLLTSERAWANAMSMREAHSADKRGITSSTKTHIISKLRKATLIAKNLLVALQDQNLSGAMINDVLEARAYFASLSGALEFEKKSWEDCIKHYSEARIIYCALATATKSDTYKDLLSDPVDPSIRYSAYKLQMPRTIAIDKIAREYFSQSDAELVALIKKLHPDTLNDQLTGPESGVEGSESIPKTIIWRSRTVNLEDASISIALASINMAIENLSGTLNTGALKQARERASAYDPVLTACQDAVDATKHAINELMSEGVSHSDHRMQSLLITRTALNYMSISWRIGRNRVLIGNLDGAGGALLNIHITKADLQKPSKAESRGRRLSRIREKVVLYDSILQSIESIKELPGIAADATLSEELDVKREYFSSLKCFALARFHAILMSPKNTLALLARASEKCSTVHTFISSTMETTENYPPNITVTLAEVNYLKDLLDGEVKRYSALVETFNLNESTDSNELNNQSPLIERLNLYPAGGVDLSNIVAYPPNLEPCPVKPLFLDVAWNFIKYPGREEVGPKSDSLSKNISLKESEQGGQAKKSWFGFGR